jgi:hypothetical protein
MDTVLHWTVNKNDSKLCSSKVSKAVSKGMTNGRFSFKDKVDA